MMKTLLLVGSLTLALALSAGAIEPQPPTIKSLDAEVGKLTQQLREAAEQIRTLQERLNKVEDRLGESFGGSSSFNTIERRLDDLERDNRR